jgi:hypothetical protein
MRAKLIFSTYLCVPFGKADKIDFKFGIKPNENAADAAFRGFRKRFSS